MMQVVVRLRADPGGRAEVDALLSAQGLSLTPLHPNTSDPTLASWFVLPAMPTDRAEEIVAALRTLPSVEAAYVQPSPAPA